jgi:hypothetical protein
MKVLILGAAQSYVVNVDGNQNWIGNLALVIRRVCKSLRQYIVRPTNPVGLIQGDVRNWRASAGIGGRGVVQAHAGAISAVRVRAIMLMSSSWPKLWMA